MPGSPVALSEAGHWRTGRLEVALCSAPGDMTRWQWQVVGTKAVCPMASLLMCGPRLGVWGCLRKLVMPTPVSNLNLCSAELFLPELCISVSPLVPEKDRLSLYLLIPILPTLPYSFQNSAFFPLEVFSPWRCPAFCHSWACFCPLLLVWSKIYYNINNATCIQGLALPRASALCKSSASAPW